MLNVEIQEDLLFPAPKDDHERDVFNSLLDSHRQVAQALNALSLSRMTSEDGSTTSVSSGSTGAYSTIHTVNKTLSEGTMALVLVTGTYDGSIAGTKSFRITADGSNIQEYAGLTTPSADCVITMQGIVTGLSGSIAFNFDAAGSIGVFSLNNINMTILEF